MGYFFFFDVYRGADYTIVIFLFVYLTLTARHVTALCYCVFGSFFFPPAAREEFFKQEDENIKKYDVIFACPTPNSNIS